MQNPTLKLKLICLPYAGGNRHAFRPYHQFLPENIEPFILDYPGHGARMREPLLTDIHEVVKDVYKQVEPLLNAPYAIYGHSMGALVGYLLAKEIQRQQQPLPMQLFLTGSEAPSVPSQHGDKHLLPQAAFFQALKEMGGIPDEVLAHADLMALMEPILRADFKAISEYRHQHGPLLDIPLTIMTGSDEHIPPGDITAWQEETLYPIRTLEFDGGHFFILQHPQQIAAEIAGQLLHAKE